MAKKKIMVDFHNILSVNDYEIPQANHQALETLINLGYSITICSWCFKQREGGDGDTQEATMVSQA